ncbi:MAG: hypothetical protein P4M05_10955, partial [Bradyrhizobium sp.]|nr:hypothetical protein [Bradyrhizobium sp.]
MGLYDYIRCKMPLPESPQPPKEEWMQTKDTAEQYLGKYTIEEDGRLIYHEIPRERVEDASSLLGFYMCPIAGA